MKGQDVLVLLKALIPISYGGMRLTLESSPSPSYSKLASELGMSASEVHAAERRLQKAGLMNLERRPVPSAAKEFLLHALKYVFPATLGAETLGMATGQAALTGLKLRKPRSLPWVWPWSEGDLRGTALEPLYRSVPVAASRDDQLHTWLAVVDCLRAGRARERRFAQKWLSDKLEGAHD